MYLAHDVLFLSKHLGLVLCFERHPHFSLPDIDMIGHMMDARVRGLFSFQAGVAQALRIMRKSIGDLVSE